MKKVFKAFNDDLAVQDVLVGRLQQHWTAGEVRPSVRVIWSPADKRMSVAGATAGTADPVAYEAATGIPMAVALLQEILLLSCGNTEAVAVNGEETMIFRPALFAINYPVEWLERVPVGADLSDLPIRFVEWLLRDLFEGDNGLPRNLDPEVQLVVAEVASLYANAIAGRSSTASEWAALRGKAVRIADLAESAAVMQIAVLVESLCWPPESLIEEIPSQVSLFLHWVEQLALQPYLPAELVARQEALALGIPEMRRAEFEPDFDRENFLAQRPLLKAALGDFYDPNHEALMNGFREKARARVNSMGQKRFEAFLKLTAMCRTRTELESS